MRTKETDKALTSRLNRLTGQLNGIKKMVEGNAACEDVLTQVNAVHGALHKLSLMILDRHMRHCVRDNAKKGKVDSAIASLAKAIESFSKMA